VLLERLRRRSELEGVGETAAPVLATLEESRDAMHAALLEALRGDRYANLLDRLVGAANEPMLGPDAGEPAGDAVPELVRRPWHKLWKRAKALGDDATDSQLHEVRIRTKRARYAAEAAAPVVSKQARAFAHAAARLQDVLGELNDSVVAGAWLSAWAEQNGDASAAGAAEALAAGEQSTAAELRGRWRTAWEELADPKLRVWM
jgi:CHAD domain-containing protein